MSERDMLRRLMAGIFALVCVAYLVVAGAMGGLHSDDRGDRVVTFVFAGVAFVAAFALLLPLVPVGWVGGGALVLLAVGGLAWDLAAGALGWGSLFWLVLAAVGSVGMGLGPARFSA